MRLIEVPTLEACSNIETSLLVTERRVLVNRWLLDKDVARVFFAPHHFKTLVRVGASEHEDNDGQDGTRN